ncbi:MAG: STAS domain-containing protein [Anaerolineae bacterium]|nr:STAS domain-containing protein [Anaerolineae bacterium]MDQ7033856.1 STAS domain-containing protein [Anaerolineae bacterium]
MLEISTETLENDVVLLKVSGAIDGSTAPELRAAIVDTATPHCKMLLDMQGIHFMSSAGLRVMLLLHRQLQKGDSHVVLIGMMEPIYDAMEATGFLKYFQTASNVESGLELLCKTSV